MGQRIAGHGRRKQQPVELPAGWYPDPDEGGDARERYYDGTDWTEQTRYGPSAHDQRMLELAEANYRGAHRVRVLIWTVVGIVVGVPLLVVLAILIVAAINHG